MSKLSVIWNKIRDLVVTPQKPEIPDRKTHLELMLSNPHQFELNNLGQCKNRRTKRRG